MLSIRNLNTRRIPKHINIQTPRTYHTHSYSHSSQRLHSYGDMTIIFTLTLTHAHAHTHTHSHSLTLTLTSKWQASWYTGPFQGMLSMRNLNTRRAVGKFPARASSNAPSSTAFQLTEKCKISIYLTKISHKHEQTNKTPTHTHISTHAHTQVRTLENTQARTYISTRTHHIHLHMNIYTSYRC